MQPPPNDLTLMLMEVSNGNKAVINDIFPIVYDELRSVASKYLHREYSQRTIETTELVHEAYIKIMGSGNISASNRAHFFGIAANAMRQLLVDLARKKNSQKRGSDHTKISLNDGLFIYSEYEDKILDLDDALTKLAEIDERLCKIVELRFFSGLNVEETAEALSCSASTVKREWRLAKAWLFKALGE